MLVAQVSFLVAILMSLTRYESEILVICQNLDSMLNSGKIQSPLLKCRDDYQEFLIIDLVVDFGTS
jgi:hypothetical protein